MCYDSSCPANGLTLYYHHHSYYSQKVWLTLIEKNVPFAEVLLNAPESKQYAPWFLEINPRGEVPVLQDNKKIIIGSKPIIDYIEDNFSSSGHYTRLMPMDIETVMKVEEIRSKVDAINANYYTCAVAFHPDLTDEKQFPFSLSCVNQNLIAGTNKLPNIIIKAAEDNPGYREILLSKADQIASFVREVSSKPYFQQELESLITLMEFLEKQLMFRPPDKEHWWLCSEEFSLADVSLTVLLYRLWLIGLHSRTFELLPHLNSYFQRARERDAFKTMTGSLLKKDLYLIVKQNWMIFVLLILGSLLVAFTILAIFLFKA